MKRRNKWFRQGTVVTAIVAGGLGILGVNRQASADRAALPAELEDQYARQVIAAEAKANGGQFADALKIGEGIPVNSQHYSTILQKQEMWAKLLLQQARNASQRGEIQKAAALVRPLMNRPNLAPEIQRLSSQWQQQAALMAQVEQAQAQEDWQEVLNSIETIRTIDADLANTPKLQEIGQKAAMKAFASPTQATADALTAKAIATPASQLELIRRGFASSPIMLHVGSTAIDISTVTKATRSDKPTAIVTPQPVPMRVAGASNSAALSETLSKAPKQVALVDHSTSSRAVSATGVDSAPVIAGSTLPVNVEPTAIELAPVEPASIDTSVPIVPAEPFITGETVFSVEEITQSSPATLSDPSAEATIGVIEVMLPLDNSLNAVQKNIQQKPDYPSVQQ